MVSDPLVAVHRALGQIEALPSSEQGRVWTELRQHGAELTSVDALSVTQVAQVKSSDRIGLSASGFADHPD